MAYTPVFSQGVKFIKIARVDDQGKDNTLSLQELNSIRIDYSDTGIIEYPITSISKYDNYFLFGVVPTNQTSSDNEVLDYKFKAGWTGSFSTGTALTTYNLSGSVSYDNLNYFNTSSGRYILNNQPNIPIIIGATASISSNITSSVTSQLFIVNTTTGLNIASSSFAVTSGSTQIVSATFTGLLTANTQIGLYVYTDDITSVTSSFYVTQSVIPNSSTSDLVVLQPYIDEDFYVSDYNVLAGDIFEPRVNSFYMDIDYAAGIITASNQQAILSGSATRATVQESNYTDNGWTNARYNGTKVSSINYNTYTPATEYTGSKGYYSFATQQVTIVPDTSIFGYTGSWPGDQTYGKQSAIDIYSNYFAKFINITPTSETIPGTSTVYITELIDINGNRLSLNENQYLLDVAYNFSQGNTVYIYPFTYPSSSNFFTTSSIVNGGVFYQPILISTGSDEPERPGSGGGEHLASFHGAYYDNTTTEKQISIPYFNNGHAFFSQSSNNTLTAAFTNDIYDFTNNWLYPFLTSSYQGYPIQKMYVNGLANGFFDTNTGSIFYDPGIGSSFNNFISWNLITSPILPGDYIRLGTTGSDFLNANPATISQTFQIKNILLENPNSQYTADGNLYTASTGSLVLDNNINSSLLPTRSGQAYIIYRRIPSENYVIINKTINLEGQGLLIPANFNPKYSPVDIARRVGVI